MAGFAFKIVTQGRADVRHSGNFHALVLYRDDTELALVREAVSRINRKAIELEGTCMLMNYFSASYHPSGLPPL